MLPVDRFHQQVFRGDLVEVWQQVVSVRVRSAGGEGKQPRVAVAAPSE